eukprot:CAMPEP_0174724482 /NCGR_PEP_ID=MMETSP1094-20130205/43418_1 /TAXON_ID=156173 /ORGANISM="Chrysochromulina brevifilum, Strain UTEX LB 985" /LENGTH=262 /DNA_ID=CAMNT_0015925707 /DNA_START=71 /DNA_END=856 /DNA_ORIENTATION=+
MSTRAEVKMLQNAFRMFDVDANGKLEGEELMRILMHGNSNVSLEDATELIASFDTNDDGVLDVNEFISAMAATTGAVGTATHAARYEYHDAKQAVRDAKLSFLKGEVVDFTSVIQRAERAELPKEVLTTLNTLKSHADRSPPKTAAPIIGATMPRGSTFIKVQTMTGKTIHVPVTPEVDTVRDIMTAIENMEGIPVDAIHLIWCGFTLTDFPRFDGTLNEIRGFGLTAGGRFVGDRFTKTDLRLRFGEDGHTLCLVVRMSKW